MSYTDPCRGDCGANHWPDCKSSCSSMQPIIYTEEDKDRWKQEEEQRQEAAKTCAIIGHDWEYTFIIYHCKQCGQTTEY